jgi:imidazoleglycerol-phosphate dehydratase/histidinol-phosphatase
MLMHYLRDRDIDLPGCAVIGDRETDLQLARNLGCRGFRLGPGLETWASIAHQLADAPRTAEVSRVTRETRVEVRLDLDRVAEPRVRTGIGFFDHMLEQLGKHGGFALELQCEGDLHIDEHHTVEDSALALGQALRNALGDKRGIERYGSATASVSEDAPAPAAAPSTFTLPMDETLALAALDFSGRPYFLFQGNFARSQVGGIATEMVPHFFRSLCETAGLNLHLSVRGENTHHEVEACFKVVARALRQAIRREGRELPSTKGVL